MGIGTEIVILLYILTKMGEKAHNLYATITAVLAFILILVYIGIGVGRILLKITGGGF